MSAERSRTPSRNEQVEPDRSPSELRLALVGAGAIAQLAHLPLLAKIKGARLVAICDNDGVKAGALAQRLGVPDIYTDMEELLEEDRVDAVVIATPNHMHEPHVLRALRSRVHVLCERPLSLTSGGVERIIATAEKVGCMVVVGNNHRFRADVQQLNRFLQGGELGRIIGMRAGQYHFKGGQHGWRSRKPEAGGGAFMEHGYPLLDLALWLSDFPEPVRVSAHMDVPRPNAVEDTMLVQLECAGGISYSFDISWAYVGQEERWWFEVLSTRGSARLAPLRVVKELNGRPTNVSPSGAAARESAFLQSYRAELAHFVAMLREETPYETPDDQLKVMRVVEAIYRAAEQGKEIQL
ncbi:MAG TPA: Gfo/Idh/MocA family oxidoreductase [Gemmatimonadaceae bacterium]|nr:Gfo/Idh/MocA family oxidoreductase [Gemmatimonadaceae bacterium]